MCFFSEYFYLLRIPTRADLRREAIFVLFYVADREKDLDTLGLVPID